MSHENECPGNAPEQVEPTKESTVDFQAGSVKFKLLANMLIPKLCLTQQGLSDNQAFQDALDKAVDDVKKEGFVFV